MDTKIVVIDDSDIARTGMTLTLQAFGFSDITPYASALDYMIAGHPYCNNTVILCDFKMPAMNGIELAEELAMRNMVNRIIIFTATAGIARDVAEKMGVDVVIVEKGCPMPQLCELIKQTREKPAFR